MSQPPPPATSFSLWQHLLNLRCRLRRGHSWGTSRGFLRCEWCGWPYRITWRSGPIHVSGLRRLEELERKGAPP